MNCLIEPDDRCRYTGSHQVVGERPEIAIDQDPADWPVVGKRYDRGDRSCIRDEVHRRRQAEQDRPAIHETMREVLMIDGVCQCRRNGSRADVERHLQMPGALWIQALRDHRDRTQNQRFSEAEFQDPDQNEKEVYGQRAGDSWQVYLQPRCQHRNAK